jgi:hypothetical protein
MAAKDHASSTLPVKIPVNFRRFAGNTPSQRRALEVVQCLPPHLKLFNKVGFI